MTTWYKAVCDDHKQVASIFVVRSPRPEGDKISWPPTHEESAPKFLSDHFGCKLRMLCDDHHDDDIANSYEHVDDSPAVAAARKRSSD